MAKKQLIVQKYGGTSVGSAERIEKVAERIISYLKKGHRLVVVVSAMGDTTDDLIDLANKINPNPLERSDREMDMLLSTGEQISAALLAMMIQKKGSQAVSYTGPMAGILTDTVHSKAKIIKIDPKRVKQELKQGKVVIVTGFQGISTQKEITTLGRGGSDLSAVALAVAINADVCEIYTDVDGIYTADPRIIPDARKLKTIDFDEILELAARGAQVMHTRAVEVGKKFNMPIHVRSSFNEKEGTIIMKQTVQIEESVVRGVALTENEAKITVRDLPDRPGVAAELFNELSAQNVNVDMIVQNISYKNTTDLSFTVAKSNLAKALKVSKSVANETGSGDVISDENIAKVSVVGVGMSAQSGVAAKTFSALAKAKINIEMISTSEISISCIVKKIQGKEALKCLHAAFELAKA